MAKRVLLISLLGLCLAAPAQAVQSPTQGACPVTTSERPSGRYGTERLWVHLPAAGVLRVQRNQPVEAWSRTCRAVAFRTGGCWRITGRAGPTTLSYVVRVVPG